MSNLCLLSFNLSMLFLHSLTYPFNDSTWFLNIGHNFIFQQSSTNGSLPHAIFLWKGGHYTFEISKWIHFSLSSCHSGFLWHCQPQVTAFSLSFSKLLYWRFCPQYYYLAMSFLLVNLNSSMRSICDNSIFFKTNLIIRSIFF